MLSLFNRCPMKMHAGRKMAWSWPEMNLSSIASRKTDANTSWSSTTPRRRTVGTTRLRPMEASRWLSSWCRVSPPGWNAASLQPHVSHLHDSSHVTLSLLIYCTIVLPSPFEQGCCNSGPSLTRRCTSQLLGVTNHCSLPGCNSSVCRRKHWMSSDNSFLGTPLITPLINGLSPHTVTLPAASGLHLFVFHPKSN